MRARDAMEDALRTVIASKPRVMHAMPGHLRRSGLTLASAQSHVYAEMGQGRYYAYLAVKEPEPPPR